MLGSYKSRIEAALSLLRGTMNSEKHFKDPIRPKQRKMSTWFAAPTKEEATTGRFPGGMTAAGDNYGVGFRTPVGKEKARPMSQGPIPQESQCFPSDLDK